MIEELRNGQLKPGERPPDRWTWVAYYAYGEPCAEADDHSFADAIAERMPHTVECHPLAEGLPAFAVMLEPDDRAVFFRQRTTPGLISGEGEWRTLHCLGRERADGTGGSYLFWDDDGHVVLSPSRELPGR